MVDLRAQWMGAGGKVYGGNGYTQINSFAPVVPEIIAFTGNAQIHAFCDPKIGSSEYAFAIAS